MSAFTSTIEIDRPPAEVFAVATDPRRFGEWQRDVVGVRMLEGGVFTTTRRLGGTLTQQVVRDEPPRTWAVRGIAGPVRAHATIGIEPLDDGRRSKVTFTLEFAGHGVGVALIPLIRRQSAKLAPNSYRALKRLIEAD